MSWLIYPCLSMVYLLLSLFEQRTRENKRIGKNLWTLFLLTPLFLMTALRDNSVGNDTHMYAVLFEAQAKQTSLIAMLMATRLEPGYAILTYVFQKIGSGYLVFQIFTSFIIYGSFWHLLRKYAKNVSLAVFFIVSYLIFTDAMNIQRSYLAVAILVLSLPHLLNGRIFKFVGVVAIASMFHYSAIFFIIVYPFSRIGWSKRRIIVFLIISVVLSVFTAPLIRLLLPQRYSSYLGTQYFKLEGNFAVYLRLAVIICFLLLTHISGYAKHIDSSKLYSRGALSIDRFLNTIPLLLTGLYVIGVSIPLMHRIGDYFAIYLSLLVSRLFSSLSSGKKKTALFVSMAFGLIAMLVIILYFRPQWNHVYPYRFALLGAN